MKHFYPAIFEPKKNSDGFVVTIPDIKGCFTQGDNIEDCMFMAQEAIGCMLENVDEKNYPVPRNILSIKLLDLPEGSFATFVMFDKEKYDRETWGNFETQTDNAETNFSLAHNFS